MTYQAVGYLEDEGPEAVPIATDRIAGQDFERTKMTHGPEGQAYDVSSDHPLPVVQSRSNTSNLTSIDVGTSQVTLLVANTSRLYATIHNHSGYELYLSLGSVANPTRFTQVLGPHALYEIPTTSIYTGIITACRPTGSISDPVMITEFLP